MVLTGHTTQSTSFFICFCSWVLSEMFEESVRAIFWSYITHCQPFTVKNKRIQTLLHNCNLQWRVAQTYSPKEFQYLFLFLALWIIPLLSSGNLHTHTQGFYWIRNKKDQFQSVLVFCFCCLQAIDRKLKQTIHTPLKAAVAMHLRFCFSPKPSHTLLFS